MLPVLNSIVTDGQRTDIIIYVFQIYAAFILNSSSPSLENTYEVIAKSVLEDPSNVAEDMRYLVPGEVKLLNSILYKHLDFYAPYKDHIFGLFGRILKDLKLEEDAMSFLATITEVFKIEDISKELVDAIKEVLTRMFQYKTKTRLKKIPPGFLKSVFIFIGRFTLTHGPQTLFDLFDEVQKDILLNFFEKEAFFIGKIGKSEIYRRHVIAGFARIVTEYQPLRGTQSMVVIIQGLIQSIVPYGRIAVGRDDADEGEPAEFQENGANFERTTFQPLYSIERVYEDKLPQVENYTLYVLQCIQEVVRHEGSDFLNNIASGLTTDSRNFFSEKLEEYGINLG